MKKLSKIVALLLACTMAMLMFTACSGETSQNKKAEDEYMAKVNANRSSSQLNNDAKLQKKAREQMFDVVDQKTGTMKPGAMKPGVIKGKYYFNTDRDSKPGKVVYTSIAEINYKDSWLDQFLTQNSIGIPDVKINTAEWWTSVGVVVETINGHTYIAVVVERPKIFS